LELKIHKIVFFYLYLYILQNIHNMATVITFTFPDEEFHCHDPVMTPEFEEILNDPKFPYNWQEEVKPSLSEHQKVEEDVDIITNTYSPCQ